MLEGGDGTAGIGKGGQKMCEGVRRRSARRFSRQLGGWTASRERGADLALAQVEPFPDALPGSISSPAVGNEAARSSDAAGDSALQKSPQRVRGHAQPTNFVRTPDAEGPTAAAPPIAVAAKDPPSADRFALGVAFVVSAQKAVANQRANRLAMRTRRLLESFRNRAPFRFAAAKPVLLAHGRSMPHENR